MGIPPAETHVTRIASWRRGIYIVNAISKSYTCYGAETDGDGREVALWWYVCVVQDGVDEEEDREEKARKRKCV